jgi:hypothetical protein
VATGRTNIVNAALARDVSQCRYGISLSIDWKRPGSPRYGLDVSEADAAAVGGPAQRLGEQIAACPRNFHPRPSFSGSHANRAAKPRGCRCCGVKRLAITAGVEVRKDSGEGDLSSIDQLAECDEIRSSGSCGTRCLHASGAAGISEICRMHRIRC